MGVLVLSIVLALSVAQRNLRNPRRDMAIVAAAGVSGKFDRIEPYDFMIIIGLLVFGVLGRIIAPPVYFLRDLIITMLGLG